MDLINRKSLTRLVAMDLLGEDLRGHSFDEIKHATSVGLADAFRRCHSGKTSDISRYAALRQVEACYKKASPADGTVPQNQIDDAVFSTRLLEDENRVANATLRSFRLFSRTDLNAAISLCHSFFPPLKEVEDEVWEFCKFGPGVTFSSKGRFGSHILSKIANASVTPEALPIAKDVLSRYYPNFFGSKSVEKLNVVRGNRLSFVPKDETKCRTIAIEPSINMFLQQGIGRWMVRRLRHHFGLDLRNQSRNQFLAKVGSLNGSLATVDMSDASSRIPRELVRLLIPADWFLLLDACRSKYGLVGSDVWTRYEMFSSQGNGFTFPLETLIFYSICAAVGSRPPVVYGDDMIIASKDFDTVTDLLTEVGGKVNILKSFHTGPFRESCGADWMLGHNVRPIYYKMEASRFSQVASLHNLLMQRWGRHALPRTLHYLWSRVPQRKRFTGPRQYASTSRALYTNTMVADVDSYFWVDPTTLDWKYNPDVQDFECKFNYWTTRPIVPKFANFGDETLWFAFLNSGTKGIESSRVVRHVTRNRKISLGSVVRQW